MPPSRESNSNGFAQTLKLNGIIAQHSRRVLKVDLRVLSSTWQPPTAL
jgi:hypothetical protein